MEKEKTVVVFLILFTILGGCSKFTPSTQATITPIIVDTLSAFNSPSSTAEIPTKIPSATSTPWAFKSLMSPNGEFVANAYFEYQLPSGLPAIEIRDKEGKLIWQIPFQGERPTSDPHRSLDIFQWSKDSSKLFFHYVLFPDGGDRAFWWTGFDLQAFDMKTGESQYVLPGEGFMSFAISPDGTQIAYTRSQDNPSIIYIRSLSTGVEKTAYVLFGSKNYIRVGDIYWSPGGTEIAFQTEASEYKAQTIYLNLATMKQQIVREYTVTTSYFQGWSEDGNLEFLDLQNGVKIVHLNPGNGEKIIIGTPTEQP